MKGLCFVLILAMGCAAKASPSLLFTEVCVANIDQTIDYSNNYGGWVELYNPTDEDVSLNGWYLSDDAEMLTKDITRGATKQFMKDKGLVDDWTGRNKIDDALRYRRTKSGHLMETGLLKRGESVMDHVYRAEGSAVNRVGNFFRKKLGRGNDAQDVQDGQYGQEWQDGQDWED